MANMNHGTASPFSGWKPRLMAWLYARQPSLYSWPPSSSSVSSGLCFSEWVLACVRIAFSKNKMIKTQWIYMIIESKHNTNIHTTRESTFLNRNPLSFINPCYAHNSSSKWPVQRAPTVHGDKDGLRLSPAGNDQVSYHLTSQMQVSGAQSWGMLTLVSTGHGCSWCCAPVGSTVPSHSHQHNRKHMCLDTVGKCAYTP